MIATRRKGATFERTVAERLRELWPEAKRGFQFRGGDEAPDVQGTPFFVECKHRARVYVAKAMAEAVADSDGRPPVVIWKENHGVELVTMRLDDWLALVKGGGTP